MLRGLNLTKLGEFLKLKIVAYCVVPSDVITNRIIADSQVMEYTDDNQGLTIFSDASYN